MIINDILSTIQKEFEIVKDDFNKSPNLIEEFFIIGEDMSKIKLESIDE